MKHRTIKLQRTFEEFENYAIEWIRSLQKAFTIKKLTMVRKPLNDYLRLYKWTVVAVIENK